MKKLWKYLAFAINNLHTQYAVPTTLGVCITSKCNIKCVYCMRETFIPSGDKITLKRLQEILKKAPYIRGVCIMGLCEPMLHPEIKEMLKWLKENNYSISLTTNGTITIDEDMFQSLMNVDDFVISIDTTNPKTFRYLRGGAKFEKVWNNFKFVIQMKKDYRLGRYDNPPMHINAVITKDNITQMEDLIKAFEPYHNDITYLMVDPVSRPDYSKDYPLAVDSRALGKFIEKFKIVAGRSPVQIMGLDYMLDNSTDWSTCPLSWQSPFIEPNGDVYFCYGYDYVAGNIFKEDLLKIWNGKKARDFRKKLKTSKPPLEQCHYCNFARKGWQGKGQYSTKNEDVTYAKTRDIGNSTTPR